MSNVLRVEFDRYPTITFTHYRQTKKGDARVRKIEKKIWDVDFAELAFDKSGRAKLSIQNKRWEETHHERKNKKKKGKKSA